VEQVTESDLRVRDAPVIDPPVDPETDPDPRPHDERFRRKGGEPMLRGEAEYLDDIAFPRLAHCAILRSPVPHARIVSIDVDRARVAPGVRAVLTARDAVDAAGPMPHVFDPVNVGGNTAVFHCLPVEEVRWAGQPIAAVAADTLAAAQAAVELIDLRLQELPFVLDAHEALAPDAPRVFSDWTANQVGSYHWTEGDPERRLAHAAHVIRDEVAIQRYYCAPMETRGYVADWKRGQLTVHASCQMPHPMRSHLATVLGMPENRIRVIAPTVGGGFGHKFHGFEEEIIVALLSRSAGTAVKWLETRADSMLVGAREFSYEMALGVEEDGSIVAFTARILGNIGALGPWGGWCMTFPAAMTLPGPYRIKDYDVETVPVVTNKAPWSGARGYGKEAAALALERMVDLAAERIGMDPAEIRRRNFIPPDEFPYWTAGKRLDSGDYPGALDQVLELADYAGLRVEQARARAEGRLFGVGVGFEVCPEGADFAGSFFRGFDTSTVRVDPSGSVTVLTGVTSPGSGSESGIALLVAEALGVPFSAVEVRQGDTESSPYGFGNFSSRALTTGGGSAVLAAGEVRDRMARVAGLMLDAPPESLRFAAGAITVSDEPERTIAFAAVADQVYRRAQPLGGEVYPQLEATRSDGPGNYQWIPDEQGRMSMYPSFPFSAHVSVVEIDPETGVVRVREHCTVDDCGVVVNHVLVESQIHGAIAMGIGGALWEHVRYDDEGRLSTATFKQYLMPRAPDLPSFRLGSQVTPSPFTSLGTKGAGESGVGGTLAAVANAVNDALAPRGVRIHEMPLSPIRILAALRETVPG
jgi:aerobic carbon-monoxide dehydrogenase large subunit